MTSIGYHAPLLEGIAKLDITQTMFREATEHYEAVAGLLEAKGLAAHIYPHGSFGTGTVVRPYDPENEETFYDLDMACVVTDESPDTVNPSELRSKVRAILQDHKVYADMMQEQDSCITLRYARSDSRPGFNLDIVIGVKPASASLNKYDLYGLDPKWKEQDLSLARINPDDWFGSNPHALCDWFKEKKRALCCP